MSEKATQQGGGFESGATPYNSSHCPIESNTGLQTTSVHRDIVVNPNWLKMMMSGNIDVSKQKKQGRSSTPSLSGSVTSSQKVIQKGLQGVIREYLQAPPVSTLPHPEFPMGGPLPSTSSIWLEEGLCQMLDIVTAMSDQGSQGSKRNTWKSTLAKTVTPKKRWEKEEDEAGNVLFYSSIYCWTPRTCWLEGLLKRVSFRLLVDIILTYSFFCITQGSDYPNIILFVLS